MAEPTIDPRAAPGPSSEVSAGREATGKNSITVVVWTLISRIAGLVRVLIIGALMGPTFFANIFQSVYLLPNTIHSTIAGPILSMVLIPTIVRALDSKGPERAKEVIGRIGGRILAIGVLGAVALMVLSPAVAWSFTAGVPEQLRHRAFLMTVLLILFVAPQVVLYGVCAVGVAAQQASGRFALAAAAPAIENVGTIVTVGIAAWIYGTGLEVDQAPFGFMILLGTGTTVSVVVHAALQQYGAYKCGVFTVPRRGWKTDPESRDGVMRVLRSIPVAACPAVTNYVLTAISSTVPGGVIVVQLAYQVYFALSFLGSRAVSMAALPRLAEAAAAQNLRKFGIAWRQGIFFAVIAGLPSLCLLAAFAWPTADLLANGKLREPALVTELAACLAVAAFAQLAGGIHDFGRQALFARLDDRGPRVASFVGLFVGLLVAPVALLVGDAAGRLSILLISVLAGEAASAVWVLRQLRLSIRPEAFANSRSLMVVGLATVAMLPGIALGHWALYVLQPERLMELVVLMVCGAVTLAAFLAVIRFIGLKAIAEPT